MISKLPEEFKRDIQEIQRKYGHLVSKEAREKYEKIKSSFTDIKQSLIALLSETIDKIINEYIVFDEVLACIINESQAENSDILNQLNEQIKQISQQGPKGANYNIDEGKERLTAALETVATKIVEMGKKQPKYVFSEVLKHPGCKNISQIAIQNETYNASYCLVSQALELNNKVQKFGFKWVKAKNGVCFGICEVDSIRNAGWIWNWDNQLNGGAYLIGNRGYCFSDWDPDVNGQKQSFLFQPQTPVYCYFDPAGKRIVFQNGTTKEKSELQLIFLQDALHPCVVTGKGDEIELIQPYDIPDIELREAAKQ